MNLRKEISKILVKWNMPTRQVAINEIIQAFEQMVKECKPKSEDYCYAEDEEEHEDFEQSIQDQYETMGESYHGGRDSGVNEFESNILSVLRKTYVSSISKKDR